MKTTTLLSVTYLIMLFTTPMVNAKAPDPAFLLNISHSVAKVHVYNAQNQLGVGSSVVVAPNQVATNCHVVANARGIAINKLDLIKTPK